MVTIGCGADVGPYPNGTLEIAQEYGRQLAQEKSRSAAKIEPMGAGLNRNEMSSRCLVATVEYVQVIVFVGPDDPSPVATVQLSGMNPAPA